MKIEDPPYISSLLTVQLNDQSLAGIRSIVTEELAKSNGHQGAKNIESFTRPLTDRCGVIRVTCPSQIFPEITMNNYDTQGYLRSNGVFDAIHKKLMLPESYIIHSIFQENMGRVWAILVESPELPCAEECLEFPSIEITHCRMEDGSIHIANINVSASCKVIQGLCASIPPISHDMRRVLHLFMDSEKPYDIYGAFAEGVDERQDRAFDAEVKMLRAYFDQESAL